MTPRGVYLLLMFPTGSTQSEGASLLPDHETGRERLGGTTTMSGDRPAADPDVSGEGRHPQPHVALPVDLLARTMNSLFAIGLDLTAARNAAEEPAAERLERAIDELDGVIRALRAGAFEEPRPPQRLSGTTDVPGKDR